MLSLPVEAARLPSPVGPLDVCARGGVLVALGFDGRDVRAGVERRFPGAPMVPAEPGAVWLAMLQRYFDGDIAALDAIPVDPGGTPFQADVWRALRQVPAGTTVSYGELARRIGRPSATRAVGLANGQNPIAVVIPCHRVIGSDGSLTGYGGGLDRKRWLLHHESARLDVFAAAGGAR